MRPPPPPPRRLPPMRRSAALAPLSRDHHDALVIAMTLARVSDVTARSSAMLFADFIVEHEAHHFALEESLLLPALPPGQRGERLAERVLADHRYLRDAAEEIRLSRTQRSAEQLRSLGARLRAHVQLEERELFPYLEQSLDSAMLERIGAELH